MVIYIYMSTEKQFCTQLSTRPSYIIMTMKAAMST